MAIRIAKPLLDALLARAALEPDREVCGLLFGSGDVIEDAVPAANVSAHPTDSFELDPQALFDAVRAERAGGRQPIGHYHSHPSGLPFPSARDAIAAHDEGQIWLIVGGAEIRAWRAVRCGSVESAFEPIDLVVD